MQKRTREILAVALLGVFLVIGVGIMSYYIFVGHNWNVAASRIDDSIGQMDGYTVVLYEGTRPLTEASAGRTQDADIDEVAQDYRSKGAGVVVVRASDMRRHHHPYIANRDGRRMGFLTADKGELRSDIRADVAWLWRFGASSTVAITDDDTLGQLASEGIVYGLSAIIYWGAGDSTPNGEYRGSAYCVRTPEVGQVGAIVVSPSGVFSTKVI